MPWPQAVSAAPASVAPGDPLCVSCTDTIISPCPAVCLSCTDTSRLSRCALAVCLSSSYVLLRLILEQQPLSQGLHPQAPGRVWTLGPAPVQQVWRTHPKPGWGSGPGAHGRSQALLPPWWCRQGPAEGAGVAVLMQSGFLFLQPNIGHLGLPHGPSGEKVAVVTVDSCDTAVAVHFGSYVGNYSCAAQGTQSGSKK